MHGRRWRTNVMAESKDMPRLRMRYAITIAAERETPCTRRMRINITHTHTTANQSLDATMKVVGGRWISRVKSSLLVDNVLEHCDPDARRSRCLRLRLRDVA